MRRTGTALWIWVHKWLGLVSMVFMVLLGTTGSIIVVWREADAWLNPALFAPATAETLVRADRAFAITATTDPGPVTTLLLPDDIWPVYIAFQSRLVDGKPVIYSVHIDPSNGRVLGARVFFAATVSQIYFLHADLLLRPFGGATVIGIVGIVLLVSASSGLYLWWPKAGWFWRSVTFRWRAATPRLLLDLHNSIGFWTSLVLLVIALSGIELIFPKAFRAVVSVVSPTTGFKAPAAPKHDGPPTIDADAALSIAVARHPDLRPSAISTTAPGHGRSTCCRTCRATAVVWSMR